MLAGITTATFADITYGAVPGRFVYVANVLDAWSRLHVGYAIGRSVRRSPHDQRSGGGYRARKAAARLDPSFRPRWARRIQAVSQHRNEGDCDGHSEATITPFWTSAVAVAGTAAASSGTI